jgi:hypothetical protein
VPAARPSIIPSPGQARINVRWLSGSPVRSSCIGTIPAEELGLETPDVLSEVTGGQETWAEGARGVIAERRELPECRCNLWTHPLELPCEFAGAGRAPVGRQTGSLRRVRGGAQRVCGHVRDTGRLRGRPCRCGACGGGGGVRRTTGEEAALDLARHRKLAPREPAGAFDGMTGPIICGGFDLEHGQDMFGAVGRPSGDEPAILHSERLG